MINLSKLTLRCIQSPSTFVRVAKHSTARPTVVLRGAIETENNTTDELKSEKQSSVQPAKENKTKTTGLVAAAFASLQYEPINSLTQTSTFAERKIAKATTVNELLAVCDENLISRQLALKIVSTLAQWSTAGKIELSDFETDSRFVKLCRILSRGSNKTRLPIARNEVRGDDLSMVLGVTGDDEAAKLVGSITMPQMIKVMSTLAQKKRRSTPLLRSLAHNISRNTAKLDLKQCADLLYSMTILNFPEPVLLERISNDAIEGLETNLDRSAVVGSLLTSIGLLRYKDAAILDALCEWMLKYNSICRPQDISALFQTLAVVNHQPVNSENLFQVLIPQLNIFDVSKPSAWLDIVWSLVLLNKASNKHITSVLDQEFIGKLEIDSNISVSSKIKLLHINAAGMYLIKNYSGSTLVENSSVRSVTITRTKDKQLMVSSMLDSLGSLFSSGAYLKSNIDSGMGFLIDGECMVNNKCNPVPVEQSEHSHAHIRIAILAYNYHDMCRGTNVPHGTNIFLTRLLEAQGYKIMVVPYTDFNPRDKLVQRVQYLEKQLKCIASSST